MTDFDRTARALARQQRATLRKSTLTADEFDLSPLEGEAALSLVTQLSRESFSLAGQAASDYSRAETPYKFVPGWPE
jgi:hypothetical protein